MNANFAQRLSEKIQRDLNPEEKEAFARCTAVVYRYPRIGALIGGSLGIYGLYRRKIWPLRKYPMRALVFGGGGALLGVQMGLVAGTIKSVQILRRLPDQEHIMKLWREIQIEVQDAKRRPFSEPREWTQRNVGDGPQDGGFGQRTLSQSEEQQGSTSSFSDFSSPQAMTESTSGQQSSNRTSRPPGTQKEQSQNIWSQIRGENAQRPATAWDRLRQGNAAAPAKPADDGSPFSSFASETSSEPERPSYEDPRIQAKDREQDEFDRLIERERRGEAEDASRTRNRFGDYN